MIGGVLLTPWQVAGYAFAVAVYTVAWTRGGRPERFAAGVMIVDLLVTTITFSWTIDGVHSPALAQDCVRLLIFGWLCFRSNRWWPFVVATANGQMIFVHVAQLLNPAVTHYAVASAHVGLLYLIDLTLLFGVFERWLAGEPAAGSAAWAKADRIKAAPRDGAACPPRTAGRSATTAVKGIGRGSRCEPAEVQG